MSPTTTGVTYGLLAALAATIAITTLMRTVWYRAGRRAATADIKMAVDDYINSQCPDTIGPGHPRHGLLVARPALLRHIKHYGAVHNSTPAPTAGAAVRAGYMLTPESRDSITAPFATGPAVGVASGHRPAGPETAPAARPDGWKGAAAGAVTRGLNRARFSGVLNPAAANHRR